MHELSIAINIIEIAEQHARESNAICVKKVELEIGQLAGVVIEAMNFALEEAVKDTLLENAEFIIHSLTPQARCKMCDTIFQLDDYFSPCPACNKVDFDIIQGKELQIKSIQIERK